MGQAPGPGEDVLRQLCAIAVDYGAARGRRNDAAAEGWRGMFEMTARSRAEAFGLGALTEMMAALPDCGVPGRYLAELSSGRVGAQMSGGVGFDPLALGWLVARVAGRGGRLAQAAIPPPAPTVKEGPYKGMTKDEAVAAYERKWGGRPEETYGDWVRRRHGPQGTEAIRELDKALATLREPPVKAPAPPAAEERREALMKNLCSLAQDYKDAVDRGDGNQAALLARSFAGNMRAAAQFGTPEEIANKVRERCGVPKHYMDRLVPRPPAKPTGMLPFVEPARAMVPTPGRAAARRPAEAWPLVARALGPGIRPRPDIPTPPVRAPQATAAAPPPAPPAAAERAPVATAGGRRLPFLPFSLFTGGGLPGGVPVAAAFTV
jgi:hypothetical protein